MNERRALSVVLVNYKVYRYLHLALQSLEQSIVYFDRSLAGEVEAGEGWMPDDLRLAPGGSANVEVWVVDNASEDGSEALIKASYPWVHWIQNTENVGFARANNQALRQATGRYLLLQNPDTVLTERTLWKCWQAMESDPMAGALGVRMLDGHGRFLRESKRGLPTPQAAFFKLTGLAALFPKHPRLGAYHAGHLDPECDHDVAILAGAFMWVRAKVAREIGLLDERYFMYGEDIDWSYRILLAGYRNRYLGTNPIIHFKGESTQKESMRYVRMFYGAMMEFASRYYGSSHSFWLHMMLRIGIAGRALLSVLRRWSVWAFHPLLDWAGFMGLMYSLTIFWENYVKANAALAYPIELKQYVLPTYVSIWVLSSWLNGAYEKPYRYIRGVRGMITGTLAIGFVYAFLPAEWRFSRGLILAGAASCLLCSLSFKWVIRYLLNNSENGYPQGKTEHVIGVGSESSMKTISQWYATKWGTRWLGYVHPGNALSSVSDECLGQTEDLKNLITTFGADEIAVDTEVVPMIRSLNIIQQFSKESISIKFLPRALPALVGGGEVIIGDSMSRAFQMNTWPSEFLNDQRLRNRVFGVFLFGMQFFLPFRLRLIYRDRSLPRNLWGDSLDWLGFSKHNAKPFLFDLELILNAHGLKTPKAKHLEIHRVIHGQNRHKAWTYALMAISEIWLPLGKL